MKKNKQHTLELTGQELMIIDIALFAYQEMIKNGGKDTSMPLLNLKEVDTFHRGKISPLMWDEMHQ